MKQNLMANRQNGMTMMSWLVVLAILVFFILIGIKMIPTYIENYGIKQVLLNLLNNASHACEGGGIITIETEKTGEEVVVRVQDNGVGIDPEIIDRIFDPFFTTKETLKGTGLGLSVSYGIVKEHAGEINVVSKPGKGATFSVTFPIQGGQNA